MINDKFKNQKLIFKKVSKKNLELIRKWRNTYEIFQQNTQFTLLNSIDQEKWYKVISNVNTDRIMFIVKNNKIPIGICGLIHLDNKNKNADIALILGELNIHGKGLGSQMLNQLLSIGFNKMKLNRIGAEILEKNKKSEHVFQKMNFKFEGKIREAIWRKGKFQDIKIYGILKKDYMKSEESIP
jgi:RimJ/RimL family protein N-acetyltransferase